MHDLESNRDNLSEIEIYKLEEVALSFMTIGSRGATAGVQATRTAQLGDNILKALSIPKSGSDAFNAAKFKKEQGGHYTDEWTKS